MSFNRQKYDICSTQQDLAESVGPGYYQMNTPPISCEPCYPYSPSVRLQRSGGSVDTSQYMIDIDSELMNITRPLSNCPSKKYLPKCPSCKTNSGEPCGQGVVGNCKSCKDEIKRGSRCPDSNLTHWKDCFLPTDETRITNPSCNLRGTGWNRWEWLRLNPQEKVEIPFDWNINNRIIVKDNHRPCIPTPITPLYSLPKGGNIPCNKTQKVCSAPTNPPSVHWRNCNNIKDY